jgi:hypothetical protein
MNESLVVRINDRIEQLGQIQRSTSLAALPDLAAVARTVRHDEKCRKVMPATAATIEATEYGLRHSARDLLDGVEAIGEVLAYCDVKEVNPNLVNELGWLLYSLGNLGAQCLLLAEDVQGATALLPHNAQPEEVEG